MARRRLDHRLDDSRLADASHARERDQARLAAPNQTVNLIDKTLATVYSIPDPHREIMPMAAVNRPSRH